MAIELGKLHLPFQREVCQFFMTTNISGTRRVDFLINEKISVELKAITKLENVHLAQALNYLEAFKTEIGLLINFGNIKLKFKRLIKNIT